MASNPLVWIDATHDAATWQVWGMHLVERQVRQLALLGISQIKIWCTKKNIDDVSNWRADLSRLYTVERLVEIVPEEGLAATLCQVKDDVLLLGGDQVYDERALVHLLDSRSGTLVYGDSSGGVYLSAHDACVLGAAWIKQKDFSLWEYLFELAPSLGLTVVKAADLMPYIASLRLTMPPFIIRMVHHREKAVVERLMYRRTFKGVIDAVARYGYYHLVRWITRHLSTTSLTPNFFTILSILGIWVAVPCFFSGYLGGGMLVAWIGVVLDSVDGKLARLRLHLSDAMGTFEHITAMFGLGLWYIGLGWHYSGGEIFVGHAETLAMWCLVGCYWLDKVLSGGFKLCFKREIFDYASVDAIFHLIALRRNIALAIFSIGLLLGKDHEAFFIMAGWMVLTTMFHAYRFVWVAIKR